MEAAVAARRKGSKRKGSKENRLSDRNIRDEVLGQLLFTILSQ